MDAPQLPFVRSVKATGMSYKFQRLREKLRDAVTSGELSGKLPGERILAEKFHANAKTLSKALTDLAAEGVLERIIGRGTFVKGQVPESDDAGQWLVLHEPDAFPAETIGALAAVNPKIEALSDATSLRPSFLNQFSAVIDLSHRTPESFLRDLTVRNMPIVLVNREPGTISLHAVIHDVPLSVMRLARQMLLAGHRALAAVEPRNTQTVTELLHRAVLQHGVEATIETCEPQEVASLLDTGATALICGCAEAKIAIDTLTAASASIPDRMSVAAVGCENQPYPCSGYFLPPARLADAVAGLLSSERFARPSVLWLAGTWHEGGTVRSMSGTVVPDMAEAPIRMGLVS